MNKAYLIKWLKATTIRTVKTMAETAIAMIPTMVTIEAVDWKTVLGTALLSGVICILTCIKGLPEIDVTEEE